LETPPHLKANRENFISEGRWKLVDERLRDLEKTLSLDAGKRGWKTMESERQLRGVANEHGE
jgi:hypothetical protein